MKREQNKNNYGYEFNSLNEFYTYICETPINEPFRWKTLSSTESDKEFSGTESFEEAVDIMKNGWKQMSERLVKEINNRKYEIAPTEVRKLMNDVVGFQPIVPLYLTGVPTNMVNQKKTIIKQKVVNITKSVSYAAFVSKEQIIEESIKALQLVKKLESQGYRVNLNVAIGTSAGGRNIVGKVRIKSANEKLNISKLAFPLVHPSMLRRLYFRFVETCPDTTNAYTGGYGHPMSTDEMKGACGGDIIIPAIWQQDINKISCLDDIK